MTSGSRFSTNEVSGKTIKVYGKKMYSAEQTQSILIVDDDPDVTELLKYKLEQDDYRCEILNDPLNFLDRVRTFQPNLILLDIMMPQLSGMQLCHILKADSIMKQIPIIFLTARNEAEDRIKGLEAGAEDYISKPFDTRELLLRVSKVLNRSARFSQTAMSKQMCIGGVILDEETHQVTIDGSEVVLTATEFRLLKLLMKRKGRVQSRESLLTNVWNYDSDIETRTVDTHIRRLREKLGPCANIIRTMRGVGYRIMES